MTERPILFSDQMVRALLAGTKTQTRRVVKPQPFDDPSGHGVQWDGGKPLLDAGYGATYLHTSRQSIERIVPKFCPYGQSGDRLYVKEKHAFLDVRKSAMSQFPLGPQNGNAVGPDVWNLDVEYSDGTENEFSVEGEKPKQTRERGEYGWRPSIHMPRWASRILLEIVAVRVERLQAISRGDAMEEGCPFPNMASGPDPREWYSGLWNEINGAGSWDANPWVWVVEFRRVPS